MFCTKCGKEITENTKFCNNCGSVINAQMGSITFKRKKQFIGCLMPISIYVDNILVGSVMVGDDRKVPVAVGNHTIKLGFWGHKTPYEISLTEENPNIEVEYKIKMGLLISTVKITNINNI